MKNCETCAGQLNLRICVQHWSFWPLLILCQWDHGASPLELVPNAAPALEGSGDEAPALEDLGDEAPALENLGGLVELETLAVASEFLEHLVHFSWDI